MHDPTSRARPDLTVADLDLTTVATYPLRHEAEIARALLEAEGIPAMVQADDEGGLNPGFFAEYGVRVLVRREQVASAANLLEGSRTTSDHTLVLHPEQYEAMAAHASYSAPEEACGLVAFDTGGNVRFVYPLTNADHSEHRFTVDAAEHFHALAHAARNGWEIAGSFHSHPAGPPQPSATDLDTLSGTSWVHIILGRSQPGSWNVAAFSIRAGEASVVRVVVGGDE